MKYAIVSVARWTGSEVADGARGTQHGDLFIIVIDSRSMDDECAPARKTAAATYLHLSSTLLDTHSGLVRRYEEPKSEMISG